MVVASLKEKKTHSKHFTSKLKSHTSVQGFFSSFLITSDLNNAGADPGFFLGGGALVSCSTSTPINHTVFFLQNTSCIRKPQVRTPCTLPLDPPL